MWGNSNKELLDICLLKYYAVALLFMCAGYLDASFLIRFG